MTLLVTGANGSLGRTLFQQLADPARFRAAVRSDRAAGQIESLPAGVRPDIVRVDYTSTASMQEAARDCSAIVHLVGIIKESANTRYAEAHEASCTTLTRAATAAGVKRIVYLSIIGSDPASPNACLASRGRAERILLEGPTAATVLRVPMVLGQGDPATQALFRQASAQRTTLVAGGRSLQQPIDARDVVRAISEAATDAGPDTLTLELAGPDCLPHRDLVARAARVLGISPPQIRSVPLFAATAFAWLAERILSNPPVTVAMLGVLQHDDDVLTETTCQRLGIELTPLDETLAHYLRVLQEAA